MPPFTTIPTIVPGFRVTDTWANTHLRDNINQVGTLYGARAFQSAVGPQALTTGIYTKIALNSETFDTHGRFDTGTYRFTPDVPGYYFAFGRVVFDNANSQRVRAMLYKNGTRITNDFSSFAPSADEHTDTTSDLVYLNGLTDYLELYGQHEAGTTQNLVAGEANVYMTVFWMGA